MMLSPLIDVIDEILFLYDSTFLQERSNQGVIGGNFMSILRKDFGIDSAPSSARDKVLVYFTLISIGFNLYILLFYQRGEEDMNSTSLLTPDSRVYYATPSKEKANSPFRRRHWTRRVEWGLNGYCLFCVAAWFYFLQSLAPFFPEWCTHGEDAWCGLIGAILFLIESILYCIGWYIDRQIHLERGEINGRIGESWNFWGNILFVMGSLGYVISAVMGVYHYYGKEYDELNFYLAILFIVDSILYSFGSSVGETSRASRPEGATLWFYSSIDWYTLATALFIFGSVLYFISALMVKMHVDTKWINLVNLFGGLTFAIDGPLYLVSGLQYREKYSVYSTTSPSPFSKSLIGRFTFSR